MLWLALSLIVAACLIEAAAWLVRIRNKQLHGQAICRDEFLKYADRLISDADTPETVTKLISSMVKKENSKKILWLFIVDVARSKQVQDQEHSAMRAIYNSIPEQQRENYVGILISFMFGLTFNNFILGPIVRRFMLYSLPKKNGGDIGPVAPVGPMIDELI